MSTTIESTVISLFSGFNLRLYTYIFNNKWTLHLNLNSACVMIFIWLELLEVILHVCHLKTIKKILGATCIHGVSLIYMVQDTPNQEFGNILPFPVTTRGLPCHCAWQEPSAACELDVFKSTESFSHTFFLGFSCSSGC